MNETEKATAPAPERTSLVKTIFIILPMMLLTLLMLSGGKIPADPKKMFALAVTFIFFNALFFLMIHTGKTDRYRAILFSIFAVCLTVSFISHYMEVRGSMGLSDANILECKTPFCHIVIPMTAIPIALSRTVIFPGTMIGAYAAIASMLVIWIGASLALGRGFCGWVCFFGGWDDGFSRILKKPVIKNIDRKWHYFPYAMLLVIMLASAIYLAPVYCEWLCPFKTVTEYAAITSVKTLVQTVIFVSLFIGLVIVLPIMTRRRIQCGLFCPFGAFQSFTNTINPFEVRINPEACVQCGRCVQVCPTFSMNKETIENGKTRMTCIKCGKCIDNCHQKAISYHVKGTPLAGNSGILRLLFLYPAFLFLATMAGGNIQDTIVRIIRLITTGSLLSM
jgi:ferredoxin-type protein NapH